MTAIVRPYFLGKVAVTALGAVGLVWPELALWVVTVLLGGDGLSLSGISSLTILRNVETKDLRWRPCAS